MIDEDLLDLFYRKRWIFDPIPPWFRRFWDRELNIDQQRGLLQLEKDFSNRRQEILASAKLQLDDLEIATMKNAQKIIGY
jgi:hypothetical protein